MWAPVYRFRGYWITLYNWCCCPMKHVRGSPGLPTTAAPAAAQPSRCFQFYILYCFTPNLGVIYNLSRPWAGAGWGGQGRGLERDYESCCRDDCRNVPGDWWPAHHHRRPFSLSCEVHFVMSQTQLLPQLNTVKSNEILSYRMESCI